MTDDIPPNKIFTPFDPPPGYREIWAREARRQEELGIPEPDFEREDEEMEGPAVSEADGDEDEEGTFILIFSHSIYIRTSFKYPDLNIPIISQLQKYIT
ncbi:hypothetical protein FKW77_000645 [Venturia effusa]|uniref:Uncharacterized protein n=1 Tax=Venturia effusa TaxID=50376 RepID=A0A517LBT8_9PEZI|nr:hypothetical protein FKW77_000645 [Venturia effusa]